MILLYGNLYIIFLVVAWYSELQEALTCCGNNAIASCLKQHHGTRQLHSSSIRLHHYNPVTLVSYDNTDTIDYAVYAFAINSMFAFHRNYTIFATSSAGGFEYENRDQRWNKVKIIHTMLEDLVNRNISDKLIIWMDSDLIVLNFELDFLALSRSNLLADVIVSRDVEPLNGMINTGCMIVRSTPWALAFFDEWWNSTDRVNGMDQHVFDLVYRRRLNDIHCNKTNDSQSISDSAQCVATKIAILAPHALNSQIPARKHQEENHKVLHLAGESSIVRTHIFKLAFSDLCRAITCSCNEYDIADTTSSVNGCLDHDYSSRCYVNVSALAPQLGITRQVLRGMDYAALLIQEVQSILTSMSLCGGMPSGGRGDGDISIDQEGGAAAVVLKNLNCDFSTIVKLRARLRDAMQSRDLADGADSGGPIQGKTTINNSADTLTQLHMEGLLWALRAHQAAYRQAFPAKNIHQSVVDLTQKPPINPNTQVRFVDGLSAKQVELDHLQAIIDAAFEVCVRKGVSSGTLHKTLTDVAPVLNKILAGVGPDSLGAALYYKFKYFDLLSGYYRGLSQHDKEYEMLKFAHETWANMSKLGFYGTGNTVADPHKEISVILARMAGKECGGELSTPNLCSVGLKHVLQSVNYTAIAWLPKRFSLELLEVNAQISSTESTELFVQRLEQILAADAGLVGVSSKVLLALSRNFLLAAACFATDDSSSKMENSPFSPLSKYVIIAAHLCAVLKKRGEDCAPLQPQQAIYTEVENVADVAPRVTINGDNKKRVKLKRKKS